MKRYKVTSNFYLDELVCPEIYAARGHQSLQLLDHRIIMGLQWLRDGLQKPIVVNDWIHRGGGYSESGLRSFTTGTGAKYSQHKYGRAFDVKIKGMTPLEVFNHIKSNERFLIDRGWITCVEAVEYTPTWLHIDCRHTGMSSILVVKP